jgi:anti-anti-sigma factor
MTPLARVSDEQLGAVAVATVEGEVDASNARAVGERLRDAMSNRSLALVVDLEPMSYVDSAGIHVLFALGHELGQRRQQLHLVVAPGSTIARMLAIVGLPGALAVHATRADAIERAAAFRG